MSEKTGKLKFIEKFGFFTYSMSLNISYNLKGTYYLTFLTLVLGLDVAKAGTMLMIGTIWDAINDPLIALFCNNHTFKNGEKIRPYALYCCVPWAISLVLIFIDFNVNPDTYFFLGLAIYFIFEGLYTFLGIPYNSLASVTTHLDSERKSINAYRSLGGAVGGGIGAVAILPIIKALGGLKDHDIWNRSDASAFTKAAIIMGIICILGALFHYFTSHERIKQEPEQERKIGFVEAYSRLFKCKSWILNMAYILCYGIINTLIMNNINYYAAFILGSSSKALPIQAVYLIFAIITALIGPAIDTKLGRKKTMLLAAIIQIVGKIPFLINPNSMITVCINAFTFAVGITLTFIMFNTNRNNITDILEYQNGFRMDSMVGAGDNLITKLAEAGSNKIMTAALATSGFISTAITQTESANNAIISLLGIIPGAFAVVMVIIILFMDVNKELEQEKQKAEKKA